jgi:hypothetical protein
MSALPPKADTAEYHGVSAKCQVSTKVRCSEKTPTHADHHTTGERPPSTLIAVPVM